MELGIPLFDEDFRVLTTDEDFVRDGLSGAVVPYLLENPHTKKSPLQIRDGEIFTWYTGTMSPQAVDEKLNYLCDALDRIPEEAWASV
ncbi:hypothetical protein OIB37_27005 [Streptomyces sp. NBC_00820]|uniref:hypothetical protein n=1 Tax=Streptomyces sp. NBC_00820 TaxID=2975842 RepID=UPI002ED4B661|nr:hypothetical protein OIB37_27005 [Streptomyces sp. NBC_00820]